MASFSVFGVDLPSIALIVLHSVEGSCSVIQCLHELTPCLSPMFICCSGDLVLHLLQGGRGGISGSEVVSSFPIFRLELVPYEYGVVQRVYAVMLLSE